MTARLIAACVSHTHLMFNNIKKKKERELIDKRDVYFILSNTPPPPLINTN